MDREEIEELVETLVLKFLGKYQYDEERIDWSTVPEGHAVVLDRGGRKVIVYRPGSEMEQKGEK
jgi:hypothetical protein